MQLNRTLISSPYCQLAMASSSNPPPTPLSNESADIFDESVPDESFTADTSSTRLSKAKRAKLNRQARKRQAAERLKEHLRQCNQLTDRDIFSQKWFKLFRRYKGIYRLYYLHSNELTSDCLDWMYLLTKINMQRMYEKAHGWGWKEKGLTRAS